MSPPLPSPLSRTQRQPRKKDQVAQRAAMSSDLVAVLLESLHPFVMALLSGQKSHVLPAELRQGSPSEGWVFLEGVFAENGAHFHGKWGLGAPSPPPKFPVHTPGPPLPGRPPPPGIFSKTPTAPQKKGGGRGARGRGGGGGRRGPIYRENEPPFRRKRLRLFSVFSWARWNRNFAIANLRHSPASRPAKLWGFKRGGVPDLDSSVPICPFLSFPDLFGDLPDLCGDFPDLSFSSFSAY